VFMQKLCTLVHEFQPAYRAGVLGEGALPYFRERIARRIARLVRALELNHLDRLDGVAGLRLLQGDVLACGTLEELAITSERAHELNHTLTDALEHVVLVRGEE